MSVIRSIAAVSAGFISLSVVVIVGTIIASSAAGAAPGAAYLAANFIISLLGAAVGGAITFSLAPCRPWLHALALASLLLILTTISGLQPAPGQPAMYPLIILVIGVAGVFGGGWTISQAKSSYRSEGGRAER